MNNKKSIIECFSYIDVVQELENSEKTDRQNRN